jgi:dCMP deaminase
MKLRQRYAHMKAAYVYADLSYCDRRKVGCVIVKDDRIISIGYNGTPPGHNNCCEDSEGNTLSTVIHAEANAINKLKQDFPDMLEGSTCFVTTVPCPECAKLIIDAKITAVSYVERRRTKPDGVEQLEKHGITVEQLTLQQQ